MTKQGTWSAKLDELERRIGDGALSMVFKVDQRYAAYQHVHQHLNHPRGGGPNYVSQPLSARHKEYVRFYAEAMLKGEGVRALADAGEDLNSYVQVLAPLDLNNLRQSGSWAVYDHGTEVYERPAQVARLPR